MLYSSVSKRKKEKQRARPAPTQSDPRESWKYGSVAEPSSTEILPVAIIILVFCFLAWAGLTFRDWVMLPSKVVRLDDVIGLPEHPVVYLDVAIDDRPTGRLEIELFSSLVPRTAENFRALCTGEKGKTSYGLALSYAGTLFHRIIPGFMAQGGDISFGQGGDSIYGGAFADEFERGLLRHDRRGLLSMANAGPDTQTSQFFVLFARASHLDGNHVVFGRVRGGSAVLDRIEDAARADRKPGRVKVAESGQFPSL